MSEESRPVLSIEAARLHRVSEPEALALVDQGLGPASSWPSGLVRYRLSAEFQSDWKVELGQWLATARQFGFAGDLTSQLLGAKAEQRANPDVDPNDRHHLKIHQQLASALFCHYLTGTGWGFSGWETATKEEKAKNLDIDLALTSYAGSLVELQIKAPGEPGVLRGGRYVNSNPKMKGTPDSQLAEALEKAASQLPRPARSVAMVGLFPQRSISLASHPECITRHLYGSSIQVAGMPGPYITRAKFGSFLRGDWNHVSGILILDLLRTSDFVFEKGQAAREIKDARYACTVLLNGNADHPADPEWFPYGRVLVQEGKRLRWVRGEPQGRHFVPSGSRIVARLPRRRPRELLVSRRLPGHPSWADAAEGVSRHVSTARHYPNHPHDRAQTGCRSSTGIGGWSDAGARSVGGRVRGTLLPI